MAVEAVIEITIGSQKVTLLSVEYSIVGPCDTAPTPTTGFTVLPTPIQIDGIKYWIEYRVI